MKKKDEKKVLKKSKFVVCEAFGSRCSICGSFFDDGDVCNNKHEIGKKYQK